MKQDLKKQKLKKILIVDDDEMDASMFSKRLEKRGFETRVLNRADKVMDLISEERFDLVLLDIVMPEIDGITLLKIIRSKFDSDDLPVIMVTAMSDSESIFLALDQGATDYITKPVNLDAAISRIKGQLSLVELHTERTKQKVLSALHAMIVTYHHRLNNPLAVAKSELQLLQETNKSQFVKEFSIISGAIQEIEVLLKDIQGIYNQTEVVYESYTDQTKMVKIPK